MGKVSPKDRESKTPKQKRRLRASSNKYLKPGALAQLRNNKASASKSCIDVAKNRRGVLADAQKIENDLVLQTKANSGCPAMSSPGKFGFSLVKGPFDMLKQKSSPGTPKTPCAEVLESESRLESLPMDLLVKIVCHLQHEQLREVFHVSQRIRKAVLLARQFHFNYTTPARSRQEMLRTITPLSTEQRSFVSKGDEEGILLPSPHTPKAPRHGPRPPSRLKHTEMQQIAAVLFQEPSFSSRCMVPSVLSKPLCKSLASNRVLFYEDELCHAVAQNKLR